jgi:hypothetical protein
MHTLEKGRRWKGSGVTGCAYFQYMVIDAPNPKELKRVFAVW